MTSLNPDITRVRASLREIATELRDIARELRTARLTNFANKVEAKAVWVENSVERLEVQP